MRPATYLRQLVRAADTIAPELAASLYELGAQRLLKHPHGNMAAWQQALTDLPDVSASLTAAATVALRSDSAVDQAAVAQALMGLHPWRKGPFDIFGVAIDCEWRSDWKWQRLLPHLAPLAERRVLDVGCGSGYHAWRMWEAGARWVLGIDPTLLYLHQFLVIKRYLPELPVWFAPVKMEELPGALGCFDTVFSMGVLYHRRDPLAHLAELAGALRAGGEVVLETLVVEGDEQTLLMPEDRYASMRNVWCLPSVPLLERWLRRSGFRQVRCVDVSVTTTSEQRSTDWMRFQSLADFLDPADNRRTCEGYPAPRRALLLAEK